MCSKPTEAKKLSSGAPFVYGGGLFYARMTKIKSKLARDAPRAD